MMKNKINLIMIFTVAVMVLLTPAVHSKEKKMKKNSETPETEVMMNAVVPTEEEGANRLDQLLDIQDEVENTAAPVEAEIPVPEAVATPETVEPAVEPVIESAPPVIEDAPASPEPVVEENPVVPEETVPAEVETAPVVAPVTPTGSAVKVEQVVLTANAGGAKKVAAAVKGTFSESCIEIESVSQGKDFVKKVFWAKINTVKAKDCSKTAAAFTENVALDLEGVSGGEYTFEINGARQAFTVHEGKEPFFEVQSGSK